MTDSIDPTASAIPSPVPAKPARQTIKPVPVDIEQLKQIAAHFGIEVRRGRGYGYEMALDQILSTISASQAAAPAPEPEPKTTHALTQQAAALEFLTQEVRMLREQVETLQRDRNHALAQLNALQTTTPQVEALQAENTRLKNAQASLMQAYQQLLSTGQAQPIEADPTQQSTPPTVTASLSAPGATPTPAPTPTPPHLAPSPRRSSTRTPGRAATRAAAIVLAVKAWNQAHPDESFAITAGLLTTTFGVNNAAAKEFVTDHQTELDDYHQAIHIANVKSHNRQLGRDPEQLKAFVTQLSQENS